MPFALWFVFLVSTSMNTDQAKTARIQPQQSGLLSPQANLGELFFQRNQGSLRDAGLD